MTAMHERYPGIARAALEIALDNGGINRARSEARQRREFNRFMTKQPEAGRLAEIDKWLAGLTEEEMLLVCAGEQSEAEAFMKEREAPLFTQQLLNDYFEQVC